MCRRIIAYKFASCIRINILSGISSAKPRKDYFDESDMKNVDHETQSDIGPSKIAVILMNIFQSLQDLKHTVKLSCEYVYKYKIS